MRLLLDSTSPSLLRNATSPTEGRPWQSPQSERFRQRLPYQGSWRAQARLRGWTKDGLTGRLLLDSTSPSRLRRATSPTEGRPWHTGKLRLFARGSPSGGAGAKRLRGFDPFPPSVLLP